MESNDNQNIISLYDVLQLFEKEYWNFFEKKHLFENQIYYNWKWYSFLAINPFSSKFDYNNKELIISVNGEKIEYKKNDDELILCHPSYEGQRILGESSDLIRNFYDECLLYTSFNTQTSNNIKSVNSSFIINIFNNGIDLSLENEDFKMNYKFYRYSDNYRYECNSDKLINQIRGNEDKLLKQIFININDCPEWAQSILFEKREKQLKKGKRLKLVRKLFPQKETFKNVISN